MDFKGDTHSLLNTKLYYILSLRPQSYVSLGGVRVKGMIASTVQGFRRLKGVASLELTPSSVVISPTYVPFISYMLPWLLYL